MAYILLTTARIRMFIGVSLILVIASSQNSFGQAELQAWGNLRGIRVQGELMKFESSIDLVGPSWSGGPATAKERQRPKYRRDGNTQVVTTRLDSFYVTEQVQDLDNGAAKIQLQCIAKKDTSLTGVFFHLKLPFNDYAKARLIVSPSDKKMAGTIGDWQNKDVNTKVSAIAFNGAQRQLKLHFDTATNVIIKKQSTPADGFIHIYVPVLTGDAKNGEIANRSFTVKASGTIDRTPAMMQLSTETGPVFAGFGGNFRLQNPRTDPQVIDYCLSNLRVAWGRVEMPWQLWQPAKDSSPIAAAKNGRLNDHVKKSMEMAQRLSKLGMPVILTAWSAPRWAVTGSMSYGPRPDGVWGNPLDTTATREIYKSIADYIQYLHDEYRVDISLFSFNESDLGINVRQTGEEHAALIKGLGAYFVSRGLATKMLLGDNSDATTYAFIYPAMKDPAARPYIGAVSFHSWRGWDTPVLQKWRDAADELHLPLIVGEGSIDAAAWNYPLIFEEPIYAMEEINLYVRMLAICKPVSILQWQLTADYSPLSGGGIFGNNEPLRPTQRFWNLKQLASIPENLSSIPATINNPDISCAAEGNRTTGVYAIHLVNNGASRTVTIKGLPANCRRLKMYTTNKTNNMKEGADIIVTKQEATVPLSENSYQTLVSSK